MVIERLLKKHKVLLTGHFVLNSGLHSKFYFEKFRILENPKATVKLCKLIAEHFKDKNIEWVIGPTTGGVMIAFETARQMKCLAGFAEEKEGKRIVGRGFDVQGKNVLIVDDVLTTGKSIQETIEAVKSKNANLAGIAVLIDRSSQVLPFEFFAPYKKVVENFKPEECPLCKAGKPLSKLGGA
jgi:orotate phosphoribosyltransferase